MNPFIYGRVVSKLDFCPRPALEKELKSHIASCQNVLVEGERRTGKTSLICETVRKTKENRLLYVDLLEIKTIDDLCRRIVKSLFSLSRSAGFFTNLIKGIGNLRPVLSVDPLTGLPEITIGSETPMEPASIEPILELVEKQNGAKRLVVVFDEFQDILNLENHNTVLALLRGKIQFQKDIPYIFSGSIRNKMNEIFNIAASPFFKSAITLEVGPIDKNQFSSFISDKFRSGKRRIEGALLDRIFPIAQDNPGDIQQLCAALWDCSNENVFIDESYLPKAFELIFSREIKGYEAHLSQFTAQQTQCLAALARAGGSAPLSSDFLKLARISQPSSVKKALTRLIDLQVIYRGKEGYKFVNPYFRAWLIAKNY
jgi:uncharacterized protein